MTVLYNVQRDLVPLVCLQIFVCAALYQKHSGIGQSHWVRTVIFGAEVYIKDKSTNMYGSYRLTGSYCPLMYTLTEQFSPVRSNWF